MMRFGKHIMVLYLFSLLVTLSGGSCSCSDELVKLSVCLPYIAASPNNLTESPPAQCCDDVAGSNNNSLCLCYLIHEPLILGFPINSDRLFSIPSLCPTPNNLSLHSLCSGSPELPPLHSITGPDRGQQRSPPEDQSQDAGPRDSNFAPEPSTDSPTGPEHGREKSLPEQQSTSAGDFDDDYIAPEPTADSETVPKSEIPTSSRSCTTMSMKNRCRWVPFSVFFFFAYNVML